MSTDTTTDTATTETATAVPGWQLAGDAPSAYEAYLVPAIFAPMAGRLVALAGLRPGDRVLDAACGTGVVSRTAAAVVAPDGSVTAVDFNPDMLGAARRACAEAGAQVEFVEGDIVDLPFDDDAFDAVTCQEALQFFPDRRAALTELRRVLVPGGRFAGSVLRGLDHQPVYAALVAALSEHAGTGAAEMMASPFALGDAEVLRADLEAVGLSQVQVRIVVGEERFPSVPDLVAQEAASSPLAASLATLESGAVEALVADLERSLAEHVDDVGIAFHNETHVLTAVA